MDNYLNAEKFGKQFKPPISIRRVQILCKTNRVPGAIKVSSAKNSAWLIPDTTPDPRNKNSKVS